MLSRFVTLRCVMSSCRVVPCRVMSQHVMFSHVTSCHVTSCHVSCPVTVTSSVLVLCFTPVMSRRVMFCRIVLSHVVSCVMSFLLMPWRSWQVYGPRTLHGQDSSALYIRYLHLHLTCLRFALIAAPAAGPPALALACATIFDEALLQFSCRVGSVHRSEDTKPPLLPPRLLG